MPGCCKPEAVEEQTTVTIDLCKLVRMGAMLVSSGLVSSGVLQAKVS